MDEVRCAVCNQPYEVHCNSSECTWWTDHECQYIVGNDRLIPTWERYYTQERGTR